MALSDFRMTDNDAEYLLGSLLHSVILEIMTYGMYTALYGVAMYLTLSRGSGRPQIRDVVFITAMWLFCSIRVIARWVIMDDIFVHHAETRESQMIAAYDGSYSLSVTSVIVSFLSVLFADITMVWRCWRLYGRRWTIITLPTLSFAVGTVAYILQSVVHFSVAGVSTPVTESTWKIIFLVTTVLTNLFCTTAIIFRILSVNGFARSLKTYHGILEIIIESAILYTSIYLVYIGLDVYTTYITSEWDVRLYYPESLANVITGIAPTLIIASISAGYSQPNDSWFNTSVSGLPGMKSTITSSMRAGSDTEVDTERTAVPQDSRANMD